MLTPIIFIFTLAFLVLSFVLIGAIVGLMTMADALLRRFSHKRLTSMNLSMPYGELSAISP
jgi:hypothetical protein